MVALLDLEDLITALNREPASPGEAAQWQFYIEAVSAFINGYVSASFEVLEDDIVRYKADYYGFIDLGGDPISSVDSVKNWQTASETVWIFDGMDRIFYLQPNEVVDVTYTHGYAAVPDDVKYMATQAVLGVLNLGATGEITSFTVGDVTEVYAKPMDDGAVATVVSLSNSVLGKYTNDQFCFRMGGPRYTTGGLLPTL